MRSFLLSVVRVLGVVCFVGGWNGVCGQTTVSYSFSAGGAVTGLNEAAPGIVLDANIGFGSFRNSGTSNPGIFSGQLRLYQNTTKGGSIKIYAQNGVTITAVNVYASGVTGPARYSIDGVGNTPLSITSGSYNINAVSATNEVEFWCVGNSSGTRIYVNSIEVTYTTAGGSPDPEPTNHPTSFSCSASGGIDLSWIDATGAQLPSGYLIRWSDAGYGSIANPVDGTEIADGPNALNVLQGVQSASITGLSPNTTYYFKIWPYTNSGTDIDYKTNGTVRQTDCETEDGPCFTESFSGVTSATGGVAGSFTNKTWTGDEGLEFTATDARTDRTINGPAIMIRNGSLSVNNITGGISSLTLTTQRQFTGGTGTLTVSVNGTTVGSIPYGASVQTSTISNIDISGTYDLEISSNNSDRIALDDLEIACFSNICVLPTVHSTNPSVSAITSNSATLNWTSGDGGSRIVVARAGGAVNVTPVDGATYLANSTFGSGAQIGADNYVVYNGTGNSVTVEGLTPGVQYYFTIFEYGCDPGEELYLTSGSPADGNFLVTPNSPENFNNVCISNTTVDLTWDAPSGDYDGFLLVGRLNPPGGELVVTGLNPNTQPFNLNWAAAPQFGGGSPQARVLYRGSATNVTVTGLTPDSEYSFRVYAYSIGNGGVYRYSSGTLRNVTAKLQDVTLAAANGFNEGVFVSWTNPPDACFDEVLVVANTTPGINFTPSGDGSAYIPSTVYAGANSIVYKADENSNSVDVTNLINGTTYYFEIFVRNGTTWSSGIEVFAIPSDVTVLEGGDLAIVSVNTAYLSSGSDDEICFFAFKDINEGTSIEFTDNGYERVSAGLWGDTEGTIRITRSGGGTIPAGTTICLRGAGNSSANFDVLLCGINDDANWSITSLNGFFTFDLNSSDQIWIIQNGSWVNPSGSHNATYTGNTVWGWTATGWESAPGYASTAGSTIPEGADCFNANLVGIGNNDKVKYTGPATAASQIEWVQRIGNPSNWTGYSSNGNYNSGGPNYSGACVNFNISSTGFSSGNWNGNKNTNWFDCGNWDDLRVPNENVDVSILNTPNQPVIGSGVANTKDITFAGGSNLTMNNAASELRVYGDWMNNSGSALSLNGNNNATIKFRSGGTQSIDGTSSTNFQRLIVENGTLLNLSTDAQVGGNGLLQVNGNSSQLGATSSSELIIQGNTTLALINGGSMNSSCEDLLDIETGGNSSTATFTGNGNPILCRNFKSIRTGSGGVVLSANTNLNCGNNFKVSYPSGTAIFTDNGNTITVGDDVRLLGISSRFNFTGTLVMTCSNSGASFPGATADIEVDNGVSDQSIQAQLNNLVINSSNAAAIVRIQGSTGSNIVTIKNNFRIQSIGTGREVQIFSNTLRIGGNWINDVDESAFNEATGTVEFYRTGDQTITCPGGEHFYNLIFSGSSNKAFNNGGAFRIANDFIIRNTAAVAAASSPSPNLDVYIGGNLTMQNTATWDITAFDNLRLRSDYTNNQTFTGTGSTRPIRCYNFRVDKSAGDLSLASNTPVEAKNNTELNFTGVSGVFTDGGNTITMGDDLILTGAQPRFNLTGTLIMTGENGDSNDMTDESNGPILAELNNLTIRGSGTNNHTRLRPNDGSGTLIIKNNLLIQDITSGLPGILNSQGNDITVGRNWTTYGPAAFMPDNGTVNFNGTLAQIINPATAQNFYNISFSGSGTKNIQGNLNVENDFEIASGSGTVSANANTFSIGGDWNNLATEATFAEGTSTVIFNGSSAQSLTCSGGERFRNVEMNNSNDGLTLNNDLIISGAAGSFAFIDGLVHTGGNEVVFLANTTNIGANPNSYVNGPVRKIGWVAGLEFEFPLGQYDEIAGIDVYQMASLTPQTSNASAGFRAQYFEENYTPGFENPNNKPPRDGSLEPGTVSTCDYWQIDRVPATPVINANVTLSWGNSECTTVIDNSFLTVARWNDLEWDNQGVTNLTGTASGTVTSGIVTTFSPFAIGTTGADLNVLPITLLSFTAEARDGNIVQCNWATAAEINNDFFTVERSVDGFAWEAVGTVQGAGNSNYTLHYGFADDTPYAGVSYYRLRQTDYDGTTTLSQVEAVFFGGADSDEFALLQAYRSDAGLAYAYTATAPYLILEVYDVSGRRLYGNAIANDQGNTGLLDLNLAQGVYMLRLSDNQGNVDTRKFFY